MLLYQQKPIWVQFDSPRRMKLTSASISVLTLGKVGHLHQGARKALGREEEVLDVLVEGGLQDIFDGLAAHRLCAVGLHSLIHSFSYSIE